MNLLKDDDQGVARLLHRSPTQEGRRQVQQRLKNGLWIRTAAHLSQGGWVQPNNRRVCAFGRIVGHSDNAALLRLPEAYRETASHGLCYKVIHLDNSSAYYDPEEFEVVGDRLNVNQRLENGVRHNPRSERIYAAIAEADVAIGDDRFCFKAGGDGDNGEHLMYLLDDLIERGVF